MTLFDNIKPTLLALFIGIALVVTSCPLAGGECRALTVTDGCFSCAEGDYDVVKGVSGMFSGSAGSPVAGG